VIFKGVLRGCRKFFQNDFVEKTNHSKYRKCISKRLDSLKIKLRSYEETFEETTPLLGFYMGCLIFPSEMKKMATMEDSELPFEKSKVFSLINEIHTLLYSFSLKKFKKAT
jgi:hypothetical protein